MAETGGAGSTEGLDRVLADLRALSGDIESCGVLSKDGGLLASSHGERLPFVPGSRIVPGWSYLSHPR